MITGVLRRKPMKGKTEKRSSEGGIAKKRVRHATITTLDDVARDICKIRDGGQCVVCQTTSFLQASHIFPKGLYKAMRWLTPNIEIRCAGDHKFKPGSPHADPAMCGEWWRKHLDKKRWQYLMKASQTITQVNPWFRDSEYERLKVEYLALTGQEWKRK
jgi:hypothetical protein